MIRKRGAPTLIELMQGSPSSVPLSSEASHSARRATGAEPPPPGGTRVIETKGMVSHAALRGAGAAEGPWDRAGELFRGMTGSPRVIWFVIAGAILLVTLTWAVAYLSGKSAGKSEIAATLPKQPPPTLPSAENDPARVPTPPPVITTPRQPETGPLPVNPVQPRNTQPQPMNPQPIPAPAPSSPTTGGTTIQKGLNYLVVAHAPQKDAEEEARYLTANGVPAATVPASSTTWQVIVTAKGYTREQMKDGALDAERAALVDRVKRLGRQWKAENRRAPTDFAQAYWARQ